tara:strand:+ start:28615 stop:28809 length:195 start_codon:yes stop_codon:yes gene_type:complete
MWVIVLLMMQFGEHRVASNQVVYPTEDACELDRATMMINLEMSKPEPNAVALSKCVKLEPKVSL